MGVCVCAVYVYVIVCMCMSVYVSVCRYTVCMSMHVYVYKFSKWYVMVCVCVCMYVCLHVCMPACMYACMHVCIYFYTFGKILWPHTCLHMPVLCIFSQLPPWNVKNVTNSSQKILQNLCVSLCLLGRCFGAVRPKLSGLGGGRGGIAGALSHERTGPEWFPIFEWSRKEAENTLTRLTRLTEVNLVSTVSTCDTYIRCHHYGASDSPHAV